MDLFGIMKVVVCSSLVHDRLARAKACVMILGAVLCIAGMLAVKSPRFLACVGPAGLEWCILGAAMFMTLQAITQQTYYLCNILDLEPPAGAHGSDDALLALTLHALVTAVHVALPVRWIVLCPTEVAAILCYIVPTLKWGSMGIPQALSQIFVFVFAILISGFGRRNLERYERAAFAQIAAEKTRRFEVEHQLEDARTVPCRPQIDGSDHTANSLPGTTFTGALFNTIDDGLLSMPWDGLKQLGHDEHWLIPAGELRVLHELVGSGGFGEVRTALYHGATVAVKVPKVQADASLRENLASIAQELRVLRYLRHPNIVLFYGASIDPPTFKMMLVLEYIRGVNLDIFVGVPPADPRTADRLKLADDVCCALMYLHAHMPVIVHGDIKGTNVLVEELKMCPTAKLVDFGLSRLLTKHARPLGGTWAWAAPEVILKQSPTAASDVFSFGRLLYLVVTGRVPLRETRRQAILEAAAKGGVSELCWPDQVPMMAECRQLCDLCLHPKPSQRPSVLEVHQVLQTWSILAASPTGPDPADANAAYMAALMVAAKEDTWARMRQTSSSSTLPVIPEETKRHMAGHYPLEGEGGGESALPGSSGILATMSMQRVSL